MFSWCRVAVCIPLIALGAMSHAEVLRGEGQPMQFSIGYGVEINEGSSLNREWVVVNDDRLPVSLSSFLARPTYSDRSWSFNIKYALNISEEVRAIEVRFIPFDIWGNAGTSLAATEIRDLSEGELELVGRWRILSESEAVQFHAMLAYVAQVKLASGAVIRADQDAVVEQARLFSEDFTSGDLVAE